MKNLILTSSGFKNKATADAIIPYLPKPPSQLKLAHIFTASNVAPDLDYIRRDKLALDDLGISCTDITLEGKNQAQLLGELSQHDIIYVQGGNPFYLLRHIRASNFDKVVLQLIKQGKWYIGVSAGSYVCCPTIEMATWKRERGYLYGVDDMKAMNFVPFLVTVHYNREKYREKLLENIPTASHSVRILTDDQALFVQNDKVELIGQGEEILASEITKP